MNEKSIESLYRIVSQLNERERKGIKRFGKQPRSRMINRLFLELVVFPFLIALLVLVGRYFNIIPGWTAQVGIAALVISYIAVPLYSLIAAAIYRKSVFSMLTNPFRLLLENSVFVAKIDVQLLRYFRAKPRDHLEFLLLQLNSEKDALQKRVGSLVGAIEKVGLIPGVLALVITVLKFGDDLPLWVYGVAYATPILYIFAITAGQMISRMERVCAIITYAIDSKELS